MEPVYSDMFTWKNGKGVGDISTVEANGGFPKGNTSMFFIRSTKTEKTVKFIVCDTLIENRELISYTYCPVDTILRKKGVKIILYND
jgi:hypothetical protein